MFVDVLLWLKKWRRRTSSQFENMANANQQKPIVNKQVSDVLTVKQSVEFLRPSGIRIREFDRSKYVAILFIVEGKWGGKRQKDPFRRPTFVRLKFIHPIIRSLLLFPNLLSHLVKPQKQSIISQHAALPLSPTKPKPSHFDSPVLQLRLHS